MTFFLRILRMALQGLGRNIMRSLLTTLGISIGVAAVIAMVEIGQGASKSVAETISSMGANNLLIQPGTASSGGVTFGSGSVMTLTPADAIALADPERCPSIAGVAPIVRTRTQVVYGNKNWVPLYIYGTTQAFLEVRDWESLAEGTAFSDQDVAGQREVCLIGQTLVRELFGDESPVGHKVRINNKPFTVVGVLSRKGANMMGSDQDDIVLAPWTTIKFKVAGQSATTTNQSAAPTTTTATGTTTPANPAAPAVNTLNNVYPGVANSMYPMPSALQAADSPPAARFTNVDQILVGATTTDDIPAAMSQIRELLRERHHIRPGQPEDFNIRDMTEMNNALGSTSNRMALLILLVSLISLIVGGVGIMNIMLVSVTERTREIGLRMAVGARARDILRQFLVEASLLCFFGGVLGILLGRLGALGVWWFMNWPIQPSLVAVIGAVVVSVLVGLVFGYYPAWKASRLDPIEALRYE
jgi:ABC-type antimicrobial peptide transport system permease subunit